MRAPSALRFMRAPSAPRHLRGILAALALASAGVASAQSTLTTLPEPIQQTLRGSGIPHAAIGAWVQEIGAARPSLAVNADLPMNPASVMKLVTTFAGLEILGPSYTWRTDFLARGVAGDTIEGDLHLRGSGDPKLTLESFWSLVRTLRLRGVREIRGDLVLDRTAYEAAEIDPGRFDNEPLRPYNVGPDPLLVNFKAVRFTFLPDPEKGTWNVVAEPKLPQIDTSATIRLAPGGCGDWRANLKADVQNGPRQARIAFGGSIPAACGERAWYVSLLSHQTYVHGLFRALWEEQGGVFRGGLREGPVPADARLLASAESQPLTEIVRDVNKWSNNVMARQVFLTLSAEVMKLPGRTDRSSRAVHSWLQQKGLNQPDLVMENGSGLSRIERISPQGMGRMLIAAFRSPVMPEFISSMPLVAYDGTMQRRARLGGMAGQAHIKTGSLNDVRSLAGYVLDRAGRRHVVVFFVNHPNAGASIAAQDAILRWVHDPAASGRNPSESMATAPAAAPAAAAVVAPRDDAPAAAQN